jgi:hypothetical protein
MICDEKGQASDCGGGNDLAVSRVRRHAPMFRHKWASIVPTELGSTFPVLPLRGWPVLLLRGEKRGSAHFARLMIKECEWTKLRPQPKSNMEIAKGNIWLYRIYCYVPKSLAPGDL